MNDHTPHPVDLFVGARIRLRRKALNISQEKLADAIFLTFQQVQKYERGANRVSASKLVEIGRALNTEPAWFFAGMPDAIAAGVKMDPEDLARAVWLESPEGLAWITIGMRLDASVRDSLQRAGETVLAVADGKHPVVPHLRRVS